MVVPQSIEKKSRNKYTVDDCVFMTLRSGYVKNNWLMFHEIQQKIVNAYAGWFGEEYARKKRFYGENTISACIRNMRKDRCRELYDLPRYGEIVIKRKRHNSKGYEYKFNLKGE